MKDLTVEIPKKYKKALIERFSLKNARKFKYGSEWTIKKPCPLCEKYYKRTVRKGRCEGCPFITFESRFGLGCFNWIECLTDRCFIEVTFDEIGWYNTENKQAREELKLLKKKARKLIRWV